jgi:PAS domain-containing protein
MDSQNTNNIKTVLKYYHGELSSVASSVWHIIKNEELPLNVSPDVMWTSKGLCLLCVANEGSFNVELHKRFLDNPTNVLNLKVMEIDSSVEVKTLNKFELNGAKSMVFFPFCKLPELDNIPRFLVMIQSKLERSRCDSLVISTILKINPSFEVLFGYLNTNVATKVVNEKLIQKALETDKLLSTASENILNLKIALDTFKSIFWMMDLDGNHVYINTKWKKMVQKPYKRGLKDLIDSVADEDKLRVTEFFDRVVGNKEENYIDCRLVLPNDQPWFRISVSGMYNDKGLFQWLLIW